MITLKPEGAWYFEAVRIVVSGLGFKVSGFRVREQVLRLGPCFSKQRASRSPKP